MLHCTHSGKCALRFDWAVSGALAGHAALLLLMIRRDVMFFDPLTVWSFVIFTTLVLAGVLFFSWFFMPEEKAFGYWGFALLLSSIGVSGVAGRSILPPFLSIELANAVLLFAALIAWTGFRSFEGRRPIHLSLVLVPLLWVVLCQFEPFRNSVANRMLVFAGMMGAIFLACLHELWRGRQDRMLARTAAMVIIAVHMALLAARPLLASTTGIGMINNEGDLLRDPYLAWYAQEWIAFLVIITFTVVALVRERREIAFERASLVDDLTGLLNRRGFMARSVQLCSPGEALALLALDLDFFKKVNDLHGHATGDRFLVMFAEVLRGNVRSTDVVARIGGEEFGVLLPRASAEVALETAERIRHAFRRTSAELNMDGVAGTVSIGVATGVMPVKSAMDGIGPLLARADIALYRAKASGRDRAEVFTPATTTDA